MKGLITPSMLNLLLRYEPGTGKLFWNARPRVFFKSDRDHKIWNTRYAGTEAFALNPSGYRVGAIFRKAYRAHRVAWAMHFGEWPDGQIDHINGDKTDNRIENLRVVDAITNCRNRRLRPDNSSGFVGVTKQGHKWRAYIRDDGRTIGLGLFDTAEDAAEARRAANERYGYHANHGSPRP